MHGEHRMPWCSACDQRSPWTGPLIDRPACPACGLPGTLRSDIVWFGEMPYRMDEIYHALARADLFVSIGTSGAVYPAAGFVRSAARRGGKECVIACSSRWSPYKEKTIDNISHYHYRTY